MPSSEEVRIGELEDRASRLQSELDLKNDLWPKSQAILQAAMKERDEAKHQRGILADKLLEAVRAAGICGEDAFPSGPELLLLADDLIVALRSESQISTPCGGMAPREFMKHIKECEVCRSEHAKYPLC